MIKIFESMLQQHTGHLERLKRWKESGGNLENYPEGETLEDFINREESAMSNIKQAIQRLKDLTL